MSNILLALLDLSHTEEGFVHPEVGKFDYRTCFAGWSDKLSGDRGRYRTLTPFRIVLEGDEPVLDYSSGMYKSEMVSGDESWTDYSAHASIRHMKIGYTALVFRMTSSLYHYAFGFENGHRLALWKAEHTVWTPLAAMDMAIDPYRYYDLEVEVMGSQIKCFLDKELVFSCEDDTFSSGAAGLYVSDRMRCKGIDVRTDAKGFDGVKSKKVACNRALENIRSEYPAAKVVAGLSSKPLRPGNVHCGNPDRFAGHPKLYVGLHEGKKVFYFSVDGSLGAMTLNGDVVWSRDYSGEFALNDMLSINDCDGSGTAHIVTASRDRFLKIDGLHGDVMCDGPLLDRADFNINTKETRHKGYIRAFADLTGDGNQSELVFIHTNVIGGGSCHTVWALDKNLNLMWRRNCPVPYGHGFCLYDVDSDGKDEIAVGNTLLNPDGTVRWWYEGAQYIDEPKGHPDHNRIGPIGPGGKLRNVVIAGDYGLYILDGIDGHLICDRQLGGHMQGMFVAKFNKDVAGLQTLVGNRWGNYGMTYIFDCDGNKISAFQPDLYSQGGTQVNWRGDGEELILFSSTWESFGLYDWRGNRVVDLSRPVRQYTTDFLWTDDIELSVIGVEDINDDGYDEIMVMNDRNGDVLVLAREDVGIASPSEFRPIRNNRGFPYLSISIPNWTARSALRNEHLQPIDQLHRPGGAGHTAAGGG